jgi:hypothetical protein
MTHAASDVILRTLDGEAIKKYLEMMALTSRASEIVVGLTQCGESRCWSSTSAPSPSTASRYHVGCIGKVLNSALLLELHATRTIDIGLPISCYLPEFKNTAVGDNILVRHVMCGTAGYLGHASVSSAARGLTWDSLVDEIKSAPILFRPGDVYSLDYSSYVVLAAIIERVCRRPWTDAVDEMVGFPLFGRRLYESHKVESVWLAAVFNVSLSVDELALLSHTLMHGAPKAGACRVLCDSTIAQLMSTVNRVPVLAGQSNWLPRGYGLGMAEYHSGLRGLCGKGSGHQSAIRVVPDRDITIAVCVDSRNAMVRHAVIDSILAELGVAREPNVESMPLPDNVPPEDLCGTYIGLRGFIVTVEFDRPKISIVLRSERHPEVRVFGTIDENHIFSIAKSSPVVGLAFFSDPEMGRPALMIGVSALRKE